MIYKSIFIIIENNSYVAEILMETMTWKIDKTCFFLILRHNNFLLIIAALTKKRQ